MRGNSLGLTTVGTLAVFLLMGGMAGCARAGGDVLPSSLEERLATRATADDYLEAARLYEAQAEALEQKVARLEERAKTLQAKPYLDPKGLRRNALGRLVGTYRSEARDMHQQYAIYRAKAQTMVTQDGNHESERSGS